MTLDVHTWSSFFLKCWFGINKVCLEHFCSDWPVSYEIYAGPKGWVLTGLIPGWILPNFTPSSWNSSISMCIPPGLPPSCAPKASLGEGLLGIFHSGIRNHLAFPADAWFLRSTGRLPYLAQTALFYIIFLLEFSTIRNCKFQPASVQTPWMLSQEDFAHWRLQTRILTPKYWLNHLQMEVTLTSLSLPD